MNELIKAIELATKSIVDTNENEWTVIELSDLEWIMEDYHQAKLKLLNLNSILLQNEVTVCVRCGREGHVYIKRQIGNHKRL